MIVPVTGDSPAEPGLKAESLADFAMLRGVGLTARRELLSGAEVRTLGAREILIEQGRPNDRMYLVLGGRLGVFLEQVEGEPLAFILAGETVGELSVLDRTPASAHVVALERSTVLAVPEDVFWRLVNVSHAFSVNLLLKLAERLRANNAAVSRNVKKRRQYERAAMFDGLTGIHNRRWLDETLHRMVRRHQRSKQPLSLSLIDVDHFKRFNDDHGHAAGDQVLTVVASTLAANLRPTDLVARFGGEEFVILFPDIAADQALHAAERVRRAVEGMEVTMPDGTPLPRVTISMGITELAAKQTVPEFLKTADRAMYRAKEAGRNCAVVALFEELTSSEAT